MTFKFLLANDLQLALCCIAIGWFTVSRRLQVTARLARQFQGLIAALAVLALAGLAGCGDQELASKGDDAANNKFRVVTTFTVIQDIAQNVAGDAAVVESITKPGAEIHDYQPTPGDIVKAQEADLVLWNGFNLERWFKKFFQNIKDVPGVVVSNGIEPIGITEGPYNGKPNPHAWMSPASALHYVENIRKALAEARSGRMHCRVQQECRGLCRQDQGHGRAACATRLSAISGEQALARDHPKAPSPISRATMACARPISGRSTPISKARHSKCGSVIELVKSTTTYPVVFSESTDIGPLRQAGRQGESGASIWRRALCRLA